MSNLPTLYQNALAQYPSETVQKAWVWCAENHDRSPVKYGADRYADEVSRLLEFMGVALPAAADVLRENQPHLNPDDETLNDLARFMLKRHANWRFGGNIKMWWEASA